MNAFLPQLCNLFENISSSEWLLYISEWEHNGQPLSNIRATTKVRTLSGEACSDSVRPRPAAAPRAP